MGKEFSGDRLGSDLIDGDCRRALVSPAILKKTSTLPWLLDDHVLKVGVTADSYEIACVLAWGRKPSAIKAGGVASRLNVPLITLEDGFIRSLGLGAADPPLSIVYDSIGIYYDATRQSFLENLINAPFDDESLARGASIRSLWREQRVSKYNGSSEHFVSPSTPYVVVVDQTVGDVSISLGRASAESFEIMLEAARLDYPDHYILIKSHPDVIAGNKKGHFDIPVLLDSDGMGVVGDVPICDVLEGADAVYVVTSQVGFEALIWGKPVVVFGLPFYAGWGLTVDRGPDTIRRSPRPLDHLVYSALVSYPRYIDPETHQRCDVESVIRWVGLQRAKRTCFDRPCYAVGFSRWKRPFIRDFLGDGNLEFLRRMPATPLREPSTIVVWGNKQDDAFPKGRGGNIVRVEDGFIRSVGLGAHLVRPLSWVLDRRGIYYDATRVSDLEADLMEHNFSAHELTRAASLRRRIVAMGITKYNVSSGSEWRRVSGEQKVILVPGQVESDASIKYGSFGITSNIGLLEAVRRDNPSAYIIYKPHPDVAAGLRNRGDGEEFASHLCDEIVTDASFTSLLESVDEICVITSLAGFEALLRGRRVITYGQPFYAGWGLTVDRRLSPELKIRRSRLLTLDQLVFCALVRYPTYVSRLTRRFTTPERILDELDSWRNERPRASLLRSLVSRLMKKK